MREIDQYWPQMRHSSETALWDAARAFAVEFCAKRESQGYTPEAVIAEIEGEFPKSDCDWGQAQYRCVLVLIQRHRGVFGNPCIEGE